MAKTVSTKEAAKQLGVGKSTVLRMIDRGDLDAYRKTLADRSHYRVYQSSIEDIKKRRGRQRS
jgi:excisionase family DNA binding protein